MSTWVDEELLNDAFNEGLGLLERARAFVGTGNAALAPAEATPLDRIRLARDMSRVTSMATCCMGLLLLYRAVADGQMDRDEMQDESRRLLAEVGANLPDPATPHPHVPQLERLINDGHHLFARLERLQNLFDTGGGGLRLS
ncbi:hypothetical protein C882_0281 [Caenispirillum salinarum AK4]|uniref:Uncharacterized protein n=1 Tax=Caenispirillum salinarum AK4 TaxID=1238182 RepID=K9GV31_9PROT|nr:DUF1465 family protein [Caenispirillum salinarum]EKV29850.1 hypothetical protein C882_0281 [Caenispirillum salinarum AK4]